MSKRIWVGGDFFYDQFHSGTVGPNKRFRIEETVSCLGGAGNTLANLRQLVQDIDIQALPTGSQSSRVLTRYIINSELVLESWSIEDSRLSDPPAFQDTWRGLQQAQRKGDILSVEALIISEYNKGAVNGTSPVPKLRVPLDLLVVDSRYRTMDLDILKMAQTKIWRCTGTEYDADWAKQFDWVVWTNHKDHIEVTGPGERFIAKVPLLDIVDTCGAGDTFTAALTAYLIKTDGSEPICKGRMHAGVCFAIQAAQNVCGKQWTAVTDFKLEP